MHRVVQAVTLALTLVSAGACGLPTLEPAPSAPAQRRRDVPLAAIFAGWYGFDPVTGDCLEGIGSTHWNDTPNTGGVVHTPYRGFYCSADPTVVSWQLEWLDRAGVRAVIFTWWGWGDTNLDGAIEGHGDQYMNRALGELLRQIELSRSSMKVALIVEPFTLTQAHLDPSQLTHEQRTMVLDYLWEHYYDAYPDQMFVWKGKPLLLAFDPMRLPQDSRYTIRHWTGRARDPNTEAEGWQWFFAPPQDILDGMSDDGAAFVYPRFDEHHAAAMGADYITWMPRRVDPVLEEGVYNEQWQMLVENREQVNLIVLYSWNLYGEQAHIEPSDGGPGPVRDDYVTRTRHYYDAFVTGYTVDAATQ